MVGLKLLSRQRLLAAITGRDAPKVTVLLAPAGYGKTVLLGQLLEQHPYQIYINLREVAGDVASLVGVIAGSIRAPDGATVMIGDTANGNSTLTAPCLARHLAALDPSVLIIDHAERLAADAEDWLLDLAQCLPPGHRMVIAGRALQSSELPLLVATDQIQVIGPEQLAFDEAELKQLAGDHHLQPSVLEPLAGWPMAVKLALTGAYGQNICTLLRALFTALPDALKAVLPRLAPYAHWPETLPGDLGLTVPVNWQHHLVMSSLPIQIGEDGSSVPHQALLTMLDQQLRRTPDEWRDAYRQAAHEAGVGGRPVEATRLLQHAGLLGEAIELSTRTVSTLIRQGHYNVVCQLLGSLPTQTITGLPALTLAYGLALLETGQLRAGLAFIQQLADHPAERWRALPYLAYGHFLLARLEEAATIIDEATAHRERYSNEQQIILMTTWGNVTRDLGDPRTSLERLLQAAQMARAHHLPYALAIVQIGLNVTYLRLQRIDDAVDAAQEALSLFEALGLFHRLPIPLLNLAILHSTRDELALASELLTRAQALAEAHNSRVVCAVDLALGNNAVKLGKHEEAIAHHRNAAARARRSARPDYQYLAELMLSESYRPLQRHDRADLHLSRAEGLLATHPELQAHHVLNHLIHFHRAQRALAGNDLGAAATAFRAVPNDIGDIQEWGARASLMLALIAQRENQLTKDHLAAFVKLHQAQPGQMYLMPDVELAQPVFQEAMRQGWFVSEVREYACLMPGQTGHRLYVRTLGELSITLDDQPLKMIGSNVTRAQELLALLGLLPPPTSRDLEQTLIGSGKGDHRNALTTLRQSLSRATGRAATVVQDTRRRYRLAEGLELRTDIQDLIEGVQIRNVSLIRQLTLNTEFLPGVDQEWAVDFLEEEVSPLLFQAFEVLAAHALENGDHREALRCCERMQALRPMSEKPLQTVIEIHRATGAQDKRHEAEREFSVLFGERGS